MTKDWGFAFPLFDRVGMRKTGDKVSLTVGIYAKPNRHKSETLCGRDGLPPAQSLS